MVQFRSRSNGKERLKGTETLSLERRLIWLHLFVGLWDLSHLHQFWKRNSDFPCSHSFWETWFWFGGDVRNGIQDAQGKMTPLCMKCLILVIDSYWPPGHLCQCLAGYLLEKWRPSGLELKILVYDLKGGLYLLAVFPSRSQNKRKTASRVGWGPRSKLGPLGLCKGPGWRWAWHTYD